MLSISLLYLMYYVPLLVAISLVYGGTRHEDFETIVRQAIHTGLWITGFMGVIFAIMWVLALMI
jgi:hypothetical protein